MNRIFRNTIFYLLIFLVIIGIVGVFQKGNEPTKDISYNEFITQLENGEVKSFSMQPERGVYEIRGQLKDQKEDDYFLTYVPDSEVTLDRLDAAAANTEVEV